MSSTQQLLLGEGAGGAIPAYIEEVFSTYLYTGTGAALSIVNGIDLSTKGGLVWGKLRDITADHRLTDTVRGSAFGLSSNNINAENNDSSQLTSFNANGFTVGSGSYYNNSGSTVVTWTFREQPKFFDIVTYSGSNSNQTISHNLGSAPGCIIIKKLDSNTFNAGWAVYHRSLANPNNNYLVLNTSAATADYGAAFISSVSSTTFTVAGGAGSISLAGSTYVAYLFAHNAGGFGLTGADNVISCGSFTADGAGVATVSLGYEPQLILFKFDSNDAWGIFDTTRGMSQTGWNGLAPNTNADEVARTNQSDLNIRPSATGFTITWSPQASNTAIYIAIRRGPMKVPTVGTSVYDAISRTGTGATATVTGLNFPPDLLFVAANTSGGYGTVAWDRLRGISPYIGTFNSNPEANSANSILSYNMDGITVGTDTSSLQVNQSGRLYINWFFRRAPSFFDEVCYTGTGSLGNTLTHNLGVTPELMIVKCRPNSPTNWTVYTAATGNTAALILNDSGSVFSGDINYWNNTSPTATQFTVGLYGTVNGSARTYVAYLFATCAGVSKVGNYTGNGTTQTIDCGFGANGARFVLIKRTDSTGDWYTYDTVRGMTVLTDPYYLLNSTAAQVASAGSVTTVSTGFALDAGILAAINTSSASYIFLAIA
jgi:hypothetical protein